MGTATWAQVWEWDESWVFRITHHKKLWEEHVFLGLVW